MMVKPAFGSRQRHDRLVPLTTALLGAALPPDSLARVLIADFCKVRGKSQIDSVIDIQASLRRFVGEAVVRIRRNAAQCISTEYTSFRPSTVGDAGAASRSPALESLQENIDTADRASAWVREPVFSAIRDS